MPTCKIIQSYDNSSKWSLNDVVDITDPWTLIKEGKVVLLNEKGEEIAPPGTVMKCPICIYQTQDIAEFGAHIIFHAKKPVGNPPKSTGSPTLVETAQPTVVNEDQKAKKREEFLARMQHGRELKKQEKIAQNALKEAKEALKVAKG